MPASETPTNPTRPPERDSHSTAAAVQEPELESGASESLPPAQGIYGIRSSSRYVDYDTHELLEKITQYEDERRWQRIREGIWISLLLHIVFFASLYFVPRYVFHHVEVIDPIDAIKHQAKTITVGTSRSEDDLFDSGLVRALLAAGVPRDRLNYRSLRTLGALDPAVARVTGYTRYLVDGDPSEGNAVITVVDKGGAASSITSRAEHGAPLQGTKNRAARQRWVTAVVGFDGRTLVHVPETKGTETTAITTLHVEFADRLAPDVAAGVLDGYQERLAAIREAVTESQPTFDQSVLATVPVVELLTAPVHFLAVHWRRG